jgi:hypothetical protein
MIHQKNRLYNIDESDNFRYSYRFNIFKNLLAVSNIYIMTFYRH